ncbi:uncharacterized protein LOC108915813 [Anoplophora glabripennis]|uniref:uncharacterized protein LOC108915813 n=1 Tax=Anoplophora glabripennis TaxID=217634 RepID=UPI000873B5A4|nr:uncharacterized protein LOC108915813 [Anoplophora glabripennis]
MVASIVVLEAAFHVCLVIANFSASMDFIILRRNSKMEIEAMLDKIEKQCVRNIFSYYSMMSSNIFYISLLSFKLYLDLFRTEHLLKVMNNYMEERMKKKSAVWTVSTIRPRKSNLKIFIEIYSELLETFGRMNSLYGFHFLTIILNVTVMVLHFSNFSLKVAAQRSGRPFNPFTLITDAFLIAAFTGHGIMITQICDRVTEQIKTTVSACYRNLITLPDNPTFDEECDDKLALKLFADHLSSSNVTFSASGLFPVDLTAFFMIFASIAMYLVIIPLDK